METTPKKDHKLLGCLWTIVVVGIFCGLADKLFQREIYPRLQRDYVIVRNDSSHTLSKMRITFGGFHSQTLVFTNVKAGSEEWRPGSRNWGKGDSSREAGVQGVLSNGKRLGANRDYECDMEIYFLKGDRFTVIVNEDGSITVPSYMFNR